MSQVVKSSKMLWSAQVAAVRASSELDRASPGDAGVSQLLDTRDIQYEFSSGRVYFAPKDPYA